MKKKFKSSRKSQKTKSNISLSGMKSSTNDNSSSIQWNTFSENSKTSNSSIVQPSNKVKNSWNNSNSTKASSCLWTEIQIKNPFVNQSSSWGKKDSLNELSKKIIFTSYSIYLTTEISTSSSTSNRLDNISGKCYHLNQKIPNNARYNNSFNEISNNQFRAYYQNSFTSYDSSWKSANKYKKINISSNENTIDYRKKEPNTICYIKPSQQQNVYK